MTDEMQSQGVQVRDFARAIGERGPYADDLLLAMTLAREAGAIASARFMDRNFKILRKSDGTPVTEVDLALHELITSRLTKARPLDRIISEEGEHPFMEGLQAASRIWVTDPLDATSNFIERRVDFAVNLALMEKDAASGWFPVLGVIDAPALGLTYVAVKGQGSWEVTFSSKTLRRLYPGHLPRTGLPRITSAWSTSQEEVQRFLSERKGSFGADQYVYTFVGAAQRYAALADGTLDAVVIPFEGMKAWDLAPGDALYRYSVRDGEAPRRSPLVYFRGADPMAIRPFILGEWK